LPAEEPRHSLLQESLEIIKKEPGVIKAYCIKLTSTSFLNISTRKNTPSRCSHFLDLEKKLTRTGLNSDVQRTAQANRGLACNTDVLRGGARHEPKERICWRLNRGLGSVMLNSL